MTLIYNAIDRAAPFWAAFGAPLVGAPIMVVMLALSPGRGAEAGAEPDADFTVEQTVEQVVASEAPAVLATGLEPGS